MSEKMRKEFELWAVGEFYMEVDVNGMYQNYLTECAWQAWQSSRAALAVEFPAYLKEKGYSDLDWIRGHNSALDDVAVALDAAGVSYK